MDKSLESVAARRHDQPPGDASRGDLLQSGLDHINQGITVADSQLRLVGWNRRFFSLLDFPEDLARLGTPFDAFIRWNAERGEYGPGDVEELVAQRVQAAHSFAPHYFERVRPSGQIIAVRGEPLPQGGFVTVYTDITEQRRQERLAQERNDELELRIRARTAELQASNDQLRSAVAVQEEAARAQRRSEAQLRLITDAVPALIAYVDRDFRYRFANRRYAERFGLTKDSIIGQSVREVLGHSVHQSIRPYLEAAGEGREVTYEYVIDVPDREKRHMRSTVVPELNEQREVAGYFVLSFDVTDQKRADAALVQAQKMEAVGQLTGGLAHDFNNLLTVIFGNLAALQGRVGSELFREYVDPAIRASQRGVSITRRLLAFARRQELEPVGVDVASLIAGSVELLRRSLPSRIAIEFSADGAGWPALADPHQLENAIVNLALNARDAMAEGGVLTIHVTTETIAEHLGERVPGEYVRISVSDAGIGMDAHTLARAFEPFFTTKPFGSGSGLGLSMVYGFVQQSGGHIQIRSEAGKGTTVTMHLPRASAVAWTGPTTDESPAPAWRRRFGPAGGGQR